MKLTSRNEIIYVDDSDADLEVAATCYEMSSLTNPFVPFSEGKQLLEHLDGLVASNGPLPALVLLDIKMPGMDGFEVLEAVRKQPRFRELPIVLTLSTSDQVEDRNRADRLGANGYVVKPFTPSTYIEFFDSLAP